MPRIDIGAIPARIGTGYPELGSRHPDDLTTCPDIDIIGSIATVAAGLASHWWKDRQAVRRDQPRKTLLLRMFENREHSWRRLDTLMHVIGADEETTKRLLLELGARASEDGKPLWGLIARNPLP
ncbi:MAG: hypothetical protein JJT88_10165 [Gammaproteobacteria bacterium]|nr:hypothetical protein [Gammaproteobacteria bacterium]